MNKGDTTELVLNYTLNGKDLTTDDFDDIELQLNSQGTVNSVKLLYSTGRIVWNDESEKFIVTLTQSETFKLKENSLNEDTNVEYQLRLLKDDNVCSSDIGTFTIGPVLSKRVLEVEN